MSLRNKLSLRGRFASPLDRSAILSSNFSRRSLASSAPPSESINLGKLESTKLEVGPDQQNSDSGSSPENKSLYYTAIASGPSMSTLSSSEDEEPETPLKIKDILFSGKKKNNTLNKEVRTLASDSEEDDDPFLRPPPPKPTRGRRSSFLGHHEVVLMTSESDEDEDPGPLTPRTPVRKVEDWLLSTSPIPSSPATPARVIHSSSSSNNNSEDEEEGVEDDQGGFVEDSEATSKDYVGPEMLNPILENMSLGEATSKAGYTLMETIREESEEDLEVEILGIKAKRLSRGVQVEMQSTSEEDEEVSIINNKPSAVSVSVQAELDDDSSDDDSIVMLLHPGTNKAPRVISDSSENEEDTNGKGYSSSEDSDKALRNFISSVKKKYSGREEDEETQNKRLSFSSEDEEDKENSGAHPEIIDISSSDEDTRANNNRGGVSLPRNEDKKYASFLSSLTPDMEEGRRHPEAVKYVNRFESHKKELTALLYKLFNTEAFGGQLPTDMEIEWNPRLRKTAGICTQRRRYMGSKTLERSSKIGLSTKVLDSGDRLRDTLIHEMCHAAAWILSGYRDGHGPVWKSWAAKAMDRFPELPIIDRCHNYQIRTKYTYKCEKCGYSIGRHSKSLDTDKKCCGYCWGRFVLLRNYKSASRTPSATSSTTPRTPNAFANFVKDHYKEIKKPGVSHGDIMKTLSTLFKATKL